MHVGEPGGVPAIVDPSRDQQSDAHRGKRLNDRLGDPNLHTPKVGLPLPHLTVREISSSRRPRPACERPGANNSAARVRTGAPSNSTTLWHAPSTARQPTYPGPVSSARRATAVGGAVPTGQARTTGASPRPDTRRSRGG